MDEEYFGQGDQNVNDQQEVPLKEQASKVLTHQEILDLVGPDVANRRVVIAMGNCREDKNFQNITSPFYKLFPVVTTRKPGEKDGKCLLQGALVGGGGQRLAKNVTGNDIVMLDHDTGETMDEIEAKIAATGLFAILWHTHSHLKPTTEIPEDKVVRWLKDTGQNIGNVGDITTSQAADYLIQNTKIKRDILAAISNVSRVHSTGGIKFIVTHPPMHRVRSLFVLKETFNFSARGTQAQAIQEWKERYAGLANMLGLNWDRSCVDPSRLMYLPRYPVGADADLYPASVMPPESSGYGKLLDIETIPRLDPKEAPAPTNEEDARLAELTGNVPGMGQRTFKAGWLPRFAALHGDDFNAADWMLACHPEGLRRDQGAKLDFECPNSESHSIETPDDTAFMVSNAGKSVSGGFHMGCLHDGCKQASNDDRLWYLDKAIEKYGVSGPEDLLPYCPAYEAKQEKQEQARAEEKKSTDELHTRIDAMTPQSTGEEIEAVIRELAKRPEGIITDDLLEMLRGRTGRKLGVLRPMLKRFREEYAKSEEGKAAGAGANTGPDRSAPDDLSKVRTIWQDWPHRVQVKAAETRFKALNKVDPFVFARPEGGRVVIQKLEKDQQIRLIPRDDQDAWSHILNDFLEFKAVTDQGIEKGKPPFKNVVSHMKAAPFDLPTIERIVTIPVFGPDGKLHTTRGYDAGLQVYLNPTAGLKFVAPSEVPEPEEVETAKLWLLEPLRDFPFTDNFGSDEIDLPIRIDGDLDNDGHALPNLKRGASSRVNMLALILQNFVRPMIKGSCPAYHLDKATPGTGASMLADVLGHILYGTAMPKMPLSAQEEELRKNIMASLRGGTDAIFHDNINHRVDSGSYASAITSGIWRDRVLGLSAYAEVPFKVAVIWAGNNVSFSNELLRRNVPIRQDAVVERPERDRGADWYKYKDLPGWLLDNRTQLIWACHTLIQNWIACGAPPGSVRMESFVSWSETLSGILECAGLERGLLCGNIPQYVGDKDDDAGTYDALVKVIDARFKGGQFGVNDLIAACEGNPLENPLGDIGLTDNDPHRRATRLGLMIKEKIVGRTFNLEPLPSGERKPRKGQLHARRGKPARYWLGDVPV